MLTIEQKKQFSEILESLGSTLDISETDYNLAVSSYLAVGKQLSKDTSTLKQYDPEILPQGSFLIGTVIKPVNPTDDIDIDLVCKLTKQNNNWTQEELKKNVGDQIKENETYKKLLETPDGRRCWTLRYRENSNSSSDKYHMDILPCMVDSGYRKILERAFSDSNLNDVESIAIRITDKERKDYDTERDKKKWYKSNPFGYAKWFLSRTVNSNKQ